MAIGTPAWHVREEDALRHVAGYCPCNDVSERAWQIEYEGQWTKGKSYYGYAPLGPWLVTADEVPDPQDVDLWLEVNDVRRQNGNTRTQIFGVAHIVSYLSRFMALQAGDVIATGTPPGVGLGHKPPLFLKAGDRVALGSRLLGEQRQSVVAYNDESRPGLLDDGPSRGDVVVRGGGVAKHSIGNAHALGWMNERELVVLDRAAIGDVHGCGLVKVVAEAPP